MEIESKIIERAAQFARGQHLTRLHNVIERQKSITTKSLNNIVEDIHDASRMDAAFLKRVADEHLKLKKELEEWKNTAMDAALAKTKADALTIVDKQTDKKLNASSL